MSIVPCTPARVSCSAPENASLLVTRASIELDCLQERDPRHKRFPCPPLLFEPNTEATD